MSMGAARRLLRHNVITPQKLDTKRADAGV